MRSYIFILTGCLISVTLLSSCLSYKYHRRFNREFKKNATVYIKYDSLDFTYPYKVKDQNQALSLNIFRNNVLSKFNRNDYELSDNETGSTVDIYLKKITATACDEYVTFTDTVSNFFNLKHVQCTSFKVCAMKIVLEYRGYINSDSIMFEDTVCVKQTENFDSKKVGWVFLDKLFHPKQGDNTEYENQYKMVHLGFNRWSTDKAIIRLAQRSADKIDEFIYRSFVKRHIPEAAEQLKREKKLIFIISGMIGFVLLLSLLLIKA